jgi:hypothetical protein
MAMHTIDIPDDRTYATGGPQKNYVEYHAMNGQVFTLDAWYYEIQEALMELSRIAYENDTSLHFIVIS